MKNEIRTAVSAVLLAAAPGAPVWALDKAAIVEHVRETYSVPPGVSISLGDPKPSDIPGFDVLELKVALGPKPQVKKLYLSKEGRYYVLGGFEDLRYSPNKERVKKMDLSGAPVRGNKKASITLVEYTDFQCPFCRGGYQIMKLKIMKDFGDKIQWVYKSMPLKSIHPWAETAAIGAECAHRQGEDGFWAVHDALFEHQKDITPRNLGDKLMEFAKAGSLDAGKFEACLKGRETQGAVDKDMGEAEALSIGGAPAFVINGQLISGADYDGIRQSIEEYLKAKHEAS